MITLSPEQIIEYFHRSYTAVDGLWFMKVEDKYGFDAALEIDEEVWKVMPKIQARKLKKLTGLGEGMKNLYECVTTKLHIEKFRFESEMNSNSEFIIHIKRCPWHDIMVQAGRKNLSQKIGPKICMSEYEGWAAEFGENIDFEITDKICRGNGLCNVRFFRSASE